jgi:Holliday junction resolvase RusA-like endonuclease
MNQLLHWFVEGTPIPQGSKTAMVVNGRAVMFEANKKHKAWRDHVKATVGSLETPSTNPVRVELMFTFERPKSVKREHMSVKPDIDKLSRSVLDAITGGIVKDDSQVIILNARKEYGDKAGVLIRVMEID